MTTLQEAAMRLALEALTSTDALPYEDWMRTSGHPAIKALNAALAQQELPQKERPDFMAGYDAGMADAKRMAQQGEPVAQARLGMKDGLAMALSVVELYGMKGDVIYREIAKLRDGIAAAPAPQAQPVKEMPHGWIVNWPDPNGGTKPVYNASSVKPKFGAELDGKLTIYAVYAHPQPAPQAQHGEPVYQYQMADGSWIDQIKDSYDYNRKYAPNATVRVVYTAAPAPQAQDKSDNYLSGYCTGRTDLLKEQSAQPVAQPLTYKRISWLWSESHNDTTDRMAFQVFARAIEAAHGIREVNER